LILLAFGKGQALHGSSGTVMGITGLFLVFYPRNDVRIFILGRLGLRTFSLASVWLVLLWMVADLVMSLAGGGGGGLYACQLGGGLCGMGAGIALLHWRIVLPVRHEENLLQVLGIQPKDAENEEHTSTGRIELISDLQLRQLRRRAQPGGNK
jgi:hypothetical protein